VTGNFNSYLAEAEEEGHVYSDEPSLTATSTASGVIPAMDQSRSSSNTLQNLISMCEYNDDTQRRSSTNTGVTSGTLVSSSRQHFQLQV